MRKSNKRPRIGRKHFFRPAAAFLFYHACISDVCIVDLLQLAVSVDLRDVVKGALAHGDFVFVEMIFKRDLIPITLFSSGGIADLLDMSRKARSVLRVPIRNSEHMMAVCSSDAELCDNPVFRFEAPIVRNVNRNSEIIRAILIFAYECGIVQKQVRLADMRSEGDILHTLPRRYCLLHYIRDSR